MQEIMKQLKQREMYLIHVIEEIEEKEEIQPIGTLRIRTENDKPIYYQRIHPSDRCGRYMTRDEDELAHQLAQKCYEEQYKKCAQKELKSIQQFMKSFHPDKCQECYSALKPLRKNIITPYEVSTEDYRKMWEQITYPPKEFKETDTTRFYTHKGERVRSKSELLIANFLNKNHIPYRYEYPLNQNKVTIYPDFTVLNVNKRRVIYWEHFGMMGNKEYTDKAIAKINNYICSGIVPGNNLHIPLQR